VQYTTGLITRARLAFALRWPAGDDGTRPPACRRYYSARLLPASG
jgi:hypothetical protein